MQEYRAGAAERAAEAARLLQARHARAWAVARRGAEMLKQDYGAEKVVVFGSLLQPKLFHVRSDVDLAAWGLDGRRYYRAVADLQLIDTEVSVDLVRMEDALPGIRATVERDGVVV